MRGLYDAIKSLQDFESLARYGLYPSKSLEKVEHKDKWDSFNFASLEFRAGELTVEAHAHASDTGGYLDVKAWDFSKPSGNALKFAMVADAEHVARVVVDYLNEYEVAA